MNNKHKTIVSFWGLSVEERKEIVGRLFPGISGLRISNMTIEQEDRLVEIPRVAALSTKFALEPVLKVCMGDVTKPNQHGYVYSQPMVDAVKKRLRESNLYGEYGSPRTEMDSLNQEEKLQRTLTVDMDKVSHEIMDIERIGDLVYIYIRTIACDLGDALVGTEKPTFGVRGTCSISVKQQQRTFTNITSFDFLGEQHV